MKNATVATFAISLLLFVGLTGLAAASFVQILQPIQQTLIAGNTQPVYLGLVGPGQKVEIVVNNDTGILSNGGITINDTNANWNILTVNQSTLPQGWRGQDSGAYEVPLKAYVIIGPNATDGQYEFTITAVNNYNDVSPLEFEATANVSSQVLGMQITNDPIKVDLGSPAVYQVQLSNIGNANDVFELTASGITGSAPVNVQVFVPKQSSVTQQITLYPSEPGAYPITFYAQSLSSGLINQTATTTLFAGSNLLTDSMAASRGMLLFPNAEAYVYALWSAIGSLLH